MKRILKIVCLFFFCLSNCQKISIKQFGKSINSDNSGPLMKYLSEEITQHYSEIDEVIYYDNLFRINTVAGKYDLALTQLDSIRNIYIKSNPTIATVIGIQHEIFIKTIKDPHSKINFQKVYRSEFNKKYNSLPIKSQIILPRHFNADLNQLKIGLDKQIEKTLNKDSIDIKTAISLSRSYNGYILVKESFPYARRYLKEYDNRNFIVKDSVLVKTKNNNEITVRVILNNKLRKPQSCILINSIYPTSEDINEAKEIASYGYTCVYIYTRGKYLSKDKIEPFEHEVEDVHHVIDWISKQPWSNGKIGMIGGSYMGFSQWAATKKLHPALKTIIPQAPVGIGTMDFPMNNNIFGSYTLRWLSYITNSKMMDDTNFKNKDKWNSIFKKWYVDGAAFNMLDSISEKNNAIFQRWLQHPSYDSYWKNMTPQKKEFNKITIPILTITGYYDSDQLGALYYLRQHEKYNKKAKHYLIIGPYDHSGAQGYIKSDLGGYEIDSVANINVAEISMKWFDYVLKKKQKPQFLKDRINYQVMGANTWKHTASINDFDKNTMKLYFQKNNMNYVLSKFKNNKESFSLIKIDLKDRSDADKIIGEEYRIVKDTISTYDGLIFHSDIIDQSFEFTGNFTGNIEFSVNKKDVDLYVRLYEKSLDGKYFLLSTYLGRASYAKNAEKRQLLVPNRKDKIRFSNNEFVSKKIEKGSILIAVIGVNKSPYYEINYGTGKDVSQETLKDAGSPVELKLYNKSYLEIPTSIN